MIGASDRGLIGYQSSGGAGSGSSGGQALASGESTLPRHAATSNGIAVASGTMRLSYLTASKTETVTQVRIVTGSTAAGATPTLVRVGIYSVAGNGDLTLVASTTNDTALLAASATGYTKALTASFTKTAGQQYAIGVLVVTAAATPTLAGTPAMSLPTTDIAATPRMCATLPSQSDLPASVTSASLANTSTVAYAVLLP